MRKSRLVKTFVAALIFSIIAFVLAIFTGSSNLKGWVNGGQELITIGSVTGQLDFLGTFKQVLNLTFNFWNENVVSYARAIGDFELWGSLLDSGIRAIPFIAYVVVLAVVLIAFIIILIQCFTHKNWKLIFIGIFGIILGAATELNIVALSVLAFGPEAMAAVVPTAAFANGYFATYGWINSPSIAYLGAAFEAQNWRQVLAIICAVVCVWGLLISVGIVCICALVYLVQAFVYTSSHKYDYLTRRERKEKIKYYKNHGFKNINEKNKNKAPEVAPQVYGAPVAPQPGVAPAPYAYAPYGYPIAGTVAPQSGGNVVQTGNNAPLIVQYITTNGGEEKLKHTKRETETAGLYGTRSVSPVETNPGLTRDDIKSAVIDVLRDNDLLKDDVHIEAPVTPVVAPVEERRDLSDDYDLLTIDDLRELIKETVGEKKEEVVETKDDVRKLVSEALKKDTVAEPVAAQVIQPVTEEKTVAPIVVAMPAKIEEAKEEKVEVAPEVEVEEEERITEEDLRTLVRTQLAEALKDIKVEETETVKEVPVYVEEKKPEIKEVVKEVVKEVPVVKEVVKEVPIVKEVPVIKEVVKQVEVPVVKEVVKEVEVPAPQPESEPVVEEKRPLIKQPDVRGKEATLEKGEVVKLNFAERVLTGGSDIVLAYNNLKNLLMSYGLKDRLSSSGDTFRLRKVTYCKITMGGQHLKLYIALDPKDYKNSAIPVGDASFKAVYKDIPLVFRVKSDLSLRRARDLINDCMREKGIEQVGPEENIDWASQLKNN